MSRTYRLNFESFGEHLEKMAVGLINEFISSLNRCSYIGNYSYCFNIRCEGYDSINYKDRRYYIIIEDGVTLNQVAKYLNKAYIMMFASDNFDDEIKQTNISVSIDRIFDKEHFEYVDFLTIHDRHFYPYHERNRFRGW